MQRNTLIWTTLIFMFVFHRILESFVPGGYYFDELVALMCVPLLIYNLVQTRVKHGTQAKRRLTKSISYLFAFLLAFLLVGLIGNILYQYQSLKIVLISAVLATKFFMIVLTSGFLYKYFPIELDKQETIYEAISLLWFAYYIVSNVFQSAQWICALEVPDKWDICAKSAVLLALLVFCDNRKRIWLHRFSVMCMAIMLLLSGKEKAYGAIIIFGVLYYLIVKKNIQTKMRLFVFMAVPIIGIAWEKIYFYYVQGQRQYAKSVMTLTALEIAKDYFPIGAGFGTFASTYAQKSYSPVYYLYGIDRHHELGVETQKYLTGYFWQTLLGETGVLGTLLYCVLILLLFQMIQKTYYYHKRKYFVLSFLFVFLMMTTFTEAGFMQPIVMIYPFIMGALLEEYELKRKDKMKYFEN